MDYIIQIVYYMIIQNHHSAYISSLYCRCPGNNAYICGFSWFRDNREKLFILTQLSQKLK